MESKQKVGMTKLNWILSIGGIIILLVLIALPPVFRIVFEEKENVNTSKDNIKPDDTSNKPDTSDIDDTNLSKVICMIQTTDDDYIENYTITLAHQDKLLEMFTEDITHTYLFDSKESESKYAQGKLACNTTNTNANGLLYTCRATDDTIQTIKKVDLSKATSADSKISLTYHQNIDDITTNLTNSGYTCQ